MWLIAGTIGFAQLTIASPARDAPVCRPVETAASDGVLAAPDNYRLLFENEDVRVLAVSVAPHSRGAAHSETRSGVDYIDATTTPNSIPTVTHFDPEGSHSLFNYGDTAFHAIRLELKHPGCFLRPNGAPIKPDATDAVVAAPLSHKVLYEDRDIRVLDVNLSAGAREPFHTHPWAGVAYVPPDNPDPALAPPNATPRIVPVTAEGLPAAQNESNFAAHFVRFELKFSSAPQEARAQ